MTDLNRGFLSERTLRVEASGIRRMFDLASSLKDPISLAIGQPHYDVPDELKAVAAKAINDGHNAYTPSQGIQELREGLLQKYDDLGIKCAQSAMITEGTSGALTCLFLATLNKGDEVLIPDPYFVSYKNLVLMLGATPVCYDMYPSFNIDAKKVESLITPKTKMILINSPANPTGVVYSSSDLQSVANVAKKHNLLVVSDDIYSDFAFDGVVPHIGTMYENVISVSSFSKSHAMTGWRVGWAVGEERLIDEMIKMQQFTFVCAPSFAQYACVAALNYSTEQWVNDYRKKRDLVVSELSEFYEIRKPDGAFYAFVKVPEKYNSDMEFVEAAVQKNLLIVPGSALSEKNTHFRISFAATDEKLAAGLSVLRSLV